MKYTVDGILPSSCLNDQDPTGSPNECADGNECESSNGVYDSGISGDKICNSMTKQLVPNNNASENSIHGYSNSIYNPDA